MYRKLSLRHITYVRVGIFQTQVQALQPFQTLCNAVQPKYLLSHLDHTLL